MRGAVADHYCMTDNDEGLLADDEPIATATSQGLLFVRRRYYPFKQVY